MYEVSGGTAFPGLHPATNLWDWRHARRRNLSLALVVCKGRWGKHIFFWFMAEGCATLNGEVDLSGLVCSAARLLAAAVHLVCLHPMANDVW